MRRLNFLYLLGPLTLSKWENNELRYSLRSLSAVFDPAWIGITGPELPPFVDHIWHTPVTLEPGSRYKNMQRQLLAACYDPFVPNDLILMNDDFIVGPSPPWDWTPTFLGPVGTEEKGNGWVRSIVRTGNWCREMGIANPLSYEGHTPMPFRKSDAAPVLEKLLAMPQSLQFRTAYGNLNRVGGLQHPNAKHKDPDDWKDSPFLSLKPTPTDKMKSFLAAMYPEKCKWEV